MGTRSVWSFGPRSGMGSGVRRTWMGGPVVGRARTGRDAVSRSGCVSDLIFDTVADLPESVLRGNIRWMFKWPRKRLGREHYRKVMVWNSELRRRGLGTEVADDIALGFDCPSCGAQVGHVLPGPDGETDGSKDRCPECLCTIDSYDVVTYPKGCVRITGETA